MSDRNVDEFFPKNIEQFRRSETARAAQATAEMLEYLHYVGLMVGGKLVDDGWLRTRLGLSHDWHPRHHTWEQEALRDFWRNVLDWPIGDDDGGLAVILALPRQLHVLLAEGSVNMKLFAPGEPLDPSERKVEFPDLNADSLFSRLLPLNRRMR